MFWEVLGRSVEGHCISISIVTLDCIGLERIVLSSFIGLILLWTREVEQRIMSLATCETVVFTGTTAERMCLWKTIETQTIFLDEFRAFVNTHLQELNKTPDCVLFIRTQLTHRITELCLMGLFLEWKSPDLFGHLTSLWEFDFMSETVSRIW